MNFSVIKRNYGHWDVVTNEGRAFRIRGNPGDFSAVDERARPYPVTKFKTITACMSFICDEMMHEEIAESPRRDGNNVPLSQTKGADRE